VAPVVYVAPPPAPIILNTAVPVSISSPVSLNTNIEQANKQTVEVKQPPPAPAAPAKKSGWLGRRLAGLFNNNAPLAAPPSSAIAIAGAGATAGAGNVAPVGVAALPASAGYGAQPGVAALPVGAGYGAQPGVNVVTNNPISLSNPIAVSTPVTNTNFLLSRPANGNLRGGGPFGGGPLGR
jgi:hypothetical protein